MIRTLTLLLSLSVVPLSIALAQRTGDAEWPAYGGDAGGSRFSPLSQIDRSNVAMLQVAWTFNTGELGTKVERSQAPSLEVT
ncbi:MAG: hypothetical protein ACLGIK_06265, partial [Gemmatimonadota bacterium]